MFKKNRMKTLLKTCVWVAAAWLSVGCDRVLDTSLELSGENRSQLEAVITHYAGEPEKQEAAKFLIRNMKRHYTADCPYMDTYYELTDSLQRDTNVAVSALKVIYDSIYTPQRFAGIKRTPDLKAVRSDFLISHIDAAFEAWKSPWAKDLTFDEFCEYILPYRVGHERLELWRDLYKEMYAPVVRPLLNQQVDSVYEVIMRRIMGNRYFTPSYVPDLRPSSLLHLRYGSCPSFVAMGAYLYRSIGVPVACDFTPNWTNHAMGHNWLSIISEGKTYPIMPGSAVAFGQHIAHNSYHLSKAYRQLFGETGGLIKDEENVPALFSDPHIVDVTDQYIQTVDVNLPDCFPQAHAPRYAYLGVFDAQNWKIVAYGKRKGKGYRFERMAPGAVYLPMYYSEGSTSSAYHPIKVDEAGGLHVLKPDTARRRSVKLYRKFMDLFPRIWLNNFAGSQFVFSCDASFRQADTIQVDTLAECNFQTVVLGKPYRYMKFIPAAKTGGNIAEIRLYDKQGKQVKGKIIGNFHPKEPEDAMKAMEMAFDGNVLSCSRTDGKQKDAWLGLDLGKTVELSKLVYLPRNDDNFIREGELYELFYWDKGWRSLGQKTGDGERQCLVYDNVPENALLLLRNLSKGKEERIFTYEGGKQVWW